MEVLNLVANEWADCFRNQTTQLERRGVSTTTLSPPRSNGRSRSVTDYARFYPAMLRRSLNGYDVVHANYGLMGPFAIAQTNRPVVLSLWGSDLFGDLGPVSRACARLADEVVVMSEVMARELDRECHVVPHGVDLDLFVPESKESAREKVGWSQHAKHVLFPYSAQREVKNFPRARRVVDAAAERVDGTVQLHPMTGLAHEDVVPRINAADVVLLTSDHEGSPNTVKEAMACNVPVVSTAVGDVPERLEGVSHSHACRSDDELVDALVSVLDHCERTNGRETARELSVERTGEQIHEVYRSALS